MALLLGNSRVLNIIDRTLPEICEDNSTININDITNYCSMMRKIGVDLFEVDLKLIKRVGRLPENFKYICRLESEYEAEVCAKMGIDRCVVKWVKLVNPYLFEILAKYGLEVTTEFRADLLSDLYKLEKLLDSGRVKNTGKIRITGLDRVVSDSWVSFAGKLAQEYRLHIDVCPVNTCNMAASIAVEAVMGGMDTITASFTGVGKGKGFSALEEVLMAIRLMMRPEYDVDLRILPELCKVFTGMSGISIPGNKPVTGSEIFWYESGIHADGIEKNPATYEPFDPAEVGQERKLVIGKHSGKKSVIKKLRELGEEVDEAEASSVLEKVRARSIELKRELFDFEIKELLLRSSMNEVMIYKGGAVSCG